MSVDRHETGQFYSGDARTYDRDRWHSRGGAATRQLQDALFRDMTASWTDELTLEVGPGTGRFTVVLAESRSTLVVTDLASGMLPLAGHAGSAAGAVVHSVRASVDDLPYASGTFKYVVCLNVLNHVESLDGALGSLARVLHPRGELLFNYANLMGLFRPAGEIINRRGTALGRPVKSRWDRPSEVTAAMSSARLVAVEERGHIHAPRSVDRLLGARVLRSANKVVDRRHTRLGSFVFVRARHQP